MSGSFYGLEIAKTGLFISQNQLQVTAHNISNADTKGYSRQRLVTQSVEPAVSNSRFLGLRGQIGGGVESQVLDQMRNDFVDREIRRENSALGQWDVHTQETQYIETLMDETSDSSITDTLSQFYASMQELSKDPVSKEIRTSLQQNALKLTQTFNHYYTQLSEMQNNENDAMKTTAGQINDLAKNIADIDKQIYSYELGGEKANDLRDQRNLMLDDLSQLVNIDYSENSQGQLNVSIEGHVLVNHTSYNALETVPDQTGVVTGTAGYYSINWQGETDPATGDPVALSYSDGKLAAYRDMRDGNSKDNIGIPYIIDNLNTLARRIAQDINTIHSTGYTMPSGATASHTGVNFFDVPGGSYANVTAKTFNLSSDVTSDVNNIAASDSLIDLNDTNNQSSNNVIALKMADLQGDVDPVDGFNCESYIKSLVVEIAIESSHSSQMYDGQKVLSDNLETRRQSISGVSIDEEMTNMIKFQHSYSAAARMITAIDDTLDTLINKMGTVGR